MPYKYIGRKTDFKGKTLWEIVGNLKNFGVGRFVQRNMMNRYEEPTFMKILKVETLPNPEKVTPDSVRKVRVWVEKTFRGVTTPKPIVIERTSYKADYLLIPKDQEQEILQKVPKAKTDEKILPKYMEMPPILKELILRDNKLKGEGNASDETRLEIVYNRRSKTDKYRVANDNEKPTVEIIMGLGTPKAPNLYKDVNL